MKRNILFLCIFGFVSSLMQAADDGRVTPPPVAPEGIVVPIDSFRRTLRNILRMPNAEQQRAQLLQLRDRIQHAMNGLPEEDRQRISFMDLLDRGINPRLSAANRVTVQRPVQPGPSRVRSRGDEEPEGLRGVRRIINFNRPQGEVGPTNVSKQQEGAPVTNVGEQQEGAPVLTFQQYMQRPRTQREAQEEVGALDRGWFSDTNSDQE